MIIVRYFILSLPFFWLPSCSNYVKGWHKKISAQQAQTTGKKIPRKAKRRTQKWKSMDKKPIENPITHSLLGKVDLKPKKAEDSKSIKKRYNPNDFIDSENTASLWNNYTSANSFFTTTKKRKIGDLVVINVEEELKRDISRELLLAFKKKEKPLRKKKKAKVPQGRLVANQQNQKPPENNEKKESAEIVYDRISTRVAEQLHDDHVTLLGRKYVFYRKKRRLIEVQALIRRDKIRDDDFIASKDIIESKIKVIE